MRLSGCACSPQTGLNPKLINAKQRVKVDEPMIARPKQLPKLVYETCAA